MFNKKKVLHPVKKKVIDSFVDVTNDPRAGEEVLEEDVDTPIELCGCGKPSHPEHRPQCWDCAHRK